VETESTQSSNRLFVIIAVALIGLICIGLLGLSAVLFITKNRAAQEEMAMQQAAIPPTPFPPTFTPTTTPTNTPTNTPEPTSTSTPVVRTPTPGAQSPLTATIKSNATATSTPIIRQTPVAITKTLSVTTTSALTNTLPGSGGVLPAASNGVLAWFGSGLLVLLLLSGVLHRISHNKTTRAG